METQESIAFRFSSGSEMWYSGHRFPFYTREVARSITIGGNSLNEDDHRTIMWNNEFNLFLSISPCRAPLNLDT